MIHDTNSKKTLKKWWQRETNYFSILFGAISAYIQGQTAVCFREGIVVFLSFFILLKGSPFCFRGSLFSFMAVFLHGGWQLQRSMDSNGNFDPTIFFGSNFEPPTSCCWKETSSIYINQLTLINLLPQISNVFNLLQNYSMPGQILQTNILFCPFTWKEAGLL